MVAVVVGAVDPAMRIPVPRLPLHPRRDLVLQATVVAQKQDFNARAGVGVGVRATWRLVSYEHLPPWWDLSQRLRG